MFVILVKAQVKPEKVEIYEKTFRDLRDKVLANEPGVTFYELCRVPDKPCTYRLVESYIDQQTQDEHMEKDYYKAASAIILDCLEGGSYEMEIVETI